MMPDGISCSAVFTPLITSVWPALWPPWKRTTACAWSVSQSTTLPFPSSPHWVPTTTTLRPRAIEAFVVISKEPSSGEFRRRAASQLAQQPLAICRGQLAVAVEFLRLVLMPGQDAEHRLALLAQTAHRLTQRGILAPRRAD